MSTDNVFIKANNSSTSVITVICKFGKLVQSLMHHWTE